MHFFLLVLGLAMIVKSADVLIESTSKIARKYGISSFIIGITVVAFGTSAPELAVGVVSGIAHTNQLTLGNIVGSSLSNIALIVGLSAIIMPLQVRDAVVKREIPMLLGIEIILLFMLFLDGVLSRMEGLLLMAGFAGFMAYITLGSKSSMKIELDVEGDIDTDGDGNRLPRQEKKQKSMITLWLLSALSLAGLFMGGKLTVDSSTRIAESFGLSETLIGLTVVALSTTMPELITSMMAAIKKEPEIVLGNCIGSNIFNILLVLGLSSAISPIPVEKGLIPDAITMVALTVFVFLVSLIGKRVRKGAGIFLLFFYVTYIAYKVVSALA